MIFGAWYLVLAAKCLEPIYGLNALRLVLLAFAVIVHSDAPCTTNGVTHLEPVLDFNMLLLVRMCHFSRVWPFLL